jgi:hypothetical protein
MDFVAGESGYAMIYELSLIERPVWGPGGIV